ncbi:MULTISPECIES: peroxiredoxin [Rhizobium/Agrobacterium group]|jgi:glutaredoxin/glutathione-dependent peroxiredoxin|uniref:Glutathione-dependent peroxiredoxin n=1 Tax=Rhizobium soli TaxID=424798 RepID=A0A7X0JH70_9HYPH|nr:MULTISPECIES: peroxiredoxin [Rhizobium/Agrobacterium group]RYE67646.1 MAG: peroxiredoxin [Rhizobiaceae bacterium]KQQ38004.1 alkyl hydroperoxide reductase [Rhizobium sp. Leaf306]KQQ73933.1 alkyl hydroperoxide reductase [Rhizobium sp. Leaf321]MBB6507503.1 peroxiredoxin [Rhizobium soli]MBD8649633.1 peroxiredoxin [Rhizobium sp. CFBP 13726]
MTIAIGEKLPSATFKEKTADGPVEISTDALFAGKKVVLFAVPGAFTPTCTLNHLPGYLDNRDALLAKGVDDIAVVAVNDWHVMGAWAQQTGGMDKIHFLADWDGAFTKAMGLDADLSAGGLGVRSKRYAMLVEDGVVKSLDIEESPGQATVSGADAMLERL